MKLRDQINSDHLQAMKRGDRVAKDILSTIRGELDNLSKDRVLGDTDVLNVLNKFLKSVKESLSAGHSDTLVRESEIISSYLPQQMSESELRELLAQIVTPDSTMKTMMSALDGKQVDRKMASMIAKELLSN
jgi:uncharacterized protein YqeY